MSTPDLIDILQLIQTLGLIGVWFYSWRLHRRTALDTRFERVDQLEQRMQTHEHEQAQQLARMDERFQHLPDSEAIARVHERVDEVNQGLHRVEGTLTQVSNQLTLINDHLINK